MIKHITYKLFFLACICLLAVHCDKDEPAPTPPPSAQTFQLKSVTVNGVQGGYNYKGITGKPIIRLSFDAVLNRSSVSSSVLLRDETATDIPITINFEKNDSVLVVQPVNNFSSLTAYTLSVLTTLSSTASAKLANPAYVNIVSGIDSTYKFPVISDAALLDTIQRAHFSYFWEFGHPVSGMARERNTSGDIVTTGGTGFGVMSIIAADSRGFITHTAALQRVQKIVSFLKNNTQKYHGAFAHWVNGNTGATIPFSTKDDGADLVETSLLMQGLLCARQYFSAADAAETTLRNDINTLWQNVEWDWFRKNNEQVLYWHWSPNYAWDMNLPIRGWNECLIVYALAASSATHGIPKSVYDNGWATNGAIKNGNSYYGVMLPLGQPQGGPLFFAHYSFLGINPNGLADAYAKYDEQNTAHSTINYNYCVANPKAYYGYSNAVWGLTASDDINGYAVHSPTSDNSVISPTAALASMPFTPVESMRALKFFYYVLGDKLWRSYGFIDAFSLHERWFANSFLAIDQGPIIVMIENYRSKLLWNLFMSCPEIKTGMKSLGFTSPNL
ncbi:MAG TPA: glucoamylase family protein [Phnomibacter sp.]|nr:glucoamylase family protein [Phnomibacter sp.]